MPSRSAPQRGHEHSRHRTTPMISYDEVRRAGDLGVRVRVHPRQQRAGIETFTRGWQRRRSYPDESLFKMGGGPVDGSVNHLKCLLQA
jgi:hypothetical protein